MKAEKMNAFFDTNIATCGASAAALAADHRADEAVFDKVRLNVYDIFKSLLNAGMKVSGEQGIAEFFLEKMDGITAAWRSSLEQAERHGNEEKAHIERIKLAAASEVRAAFLKIWEVEK